MKCQDLFSLKNEKQNLKCRLLQILLGTLTVKDLSQSGDRNILLSRLCINSQGWDSGKPSIYKISS